MGNCASNVSAFPTGFWQSYAMSASKIQKSSSLGVKNEKFTKSKRLPWSDHPMDIAHLKNCTETDCSRCLFIRNGAKWQQQFKWLIVVRESDGVRFKCECCSKYGCKTKFGEGKVDTLKRSVLDLHDKSPSHNSCWKAWVNSEAAHVAINEAPPPETFMELIKDLQRGVATLAHGRAPKETYALSEAVKADSQDDIANSCMWAMHRDESQGRLTCRYKAVDSKLQCSFGYLGTEVNGAQDAESITNSIDTLMTNFTKRFWGAPDKPSITARTKEQLRKGMKRKLAVIAVDSAANEILSAKMMRHPEICGKARHQAVAPLLKLTLRDTAHARRRAISRPWSADRRMSNAMSKLCLGKRSFPQMLQWSQEVRRVFRRHMVKRRSERGKRLSKSAVNVRAAKHRYEKFQRPLSRLSMWIMPTLEAATEVHNSRTDAAGKAAGEWLQGLDNKELLLGAGMADAADEGLCWVRQGDTEDYDSATHCREAVVFLSRIKLLFTNRKVLDMGNSFTAHMMKTLSTIIILPLKTGVKLLGDSSGVSQEIIDEVSDALGTWVSLAVTVVQTEFPDYAMVSSLSVFDVVCTSAQVALQAGGAAERKLKRIAQVCAVEFQDLVLQFKDHYPRARQIAKDSDFVRNELVWAHLVAQLDKSHKTFKHAHPWDVLLICLQLYCIAAPVTHGVESGFSKSRKGFGPQRRRASPHAECFVTRLIHDLSKYDTETKKAKLIERARLVYSHLWGRIRQGNADHKRPRLDKGVSRIGVDRGDTEAAFLKKRRVAVTQMLDDDNDGDQLERMRDVMASIPAIDEDNVDNSVKKDMRFLAKKERAMKVSAYDEHQLLEDEASLEVKIASANALKQQIQDQRRRQNKSSRDATAESGVT